MGIDRVHRRIVDQHANELRVSALVKNDANVSFEGGTFAATLMAELVRTTSWYCMAFRVATRHKPYLTSSCTKSVALPYATCVFQQANSHSGCYHSALDAVR
jgi:hypothetical protein